MAGVSFRNFRNFIRILKPLPARNTLQTTRLLSGNTETVAGFDDPRVQVLLKRLTGRNLDKILETRRERETGLPEYKLMTDEEISMAEKEIEKQAERYLQMPAVMEERKDSNKVLEKRPELDGYSECNIVFTDISQGTTNRSRQIVVHEPDGTLRESHWEERDRMNFLFFQREGQTYKMPGVLQDEHLENMFNRNAHVDVLDLVCVQCEPDSADYIRVHHHTYEDLHKRRLFDIFRSTRHFGGMVYYFTKEKRMTWLLVDMLKRNLLSDAYDIVQLFHTLHPTVKSAAIARQNNLEGIDLVKVYVENEGPHGLLQFVEENDKTVGSAQ